MTYRKRMTPSVRWSLILLTGVMKAAWDKMDDEKRAEAIAAGKFPIGVLFETNEVQEYTEAYDEVIRRAQGGK